MVLTQSSFEFKLKNGNKASLRVLKPSGAHGGWPGTPRVTREWTVTTRKSSAYQKADEKQIIAFETELGELRAFFTWVHPTLGLVCSPSN